MRRIVHLLFSAALLAAATLTATAVGASADPSPPASLCADAVTATFGPNVCVFTPQMSQTQIQDDLNNIAAQQVPLSAQFNNDGYAVFFKPGTYGSAATPLVFEVGYYTEVAGLGAVPQDTTINGQIEVFPNALDCASSTNCWANSTVNFWRSMSNLTLNVMDSANNYVPQPITQLPPIGDSADCYGGSTDMWSVSQATPVRSMIINGNLDFQAYCSQTGYGGNDYGSGSYVANSEINGQLSWSGNQQGIARNSDFESANGYVWNYVYSGDGCPPGYTPPAGTACSPNQDAFGSSPAGTEGVNGVDQVTALPQSPVTEEEPFLYTDSSGNLNAFVPAVQRNSTGPNFLSGSEAGSSLPLSSFFIANPTTPVSSINAALAHGKNLILTPGVYNLWDSIVAPHPDTVILGLGFPTLVPQTGNAALSGVPNVGVKVSGLIVDAGPVNSPVLVDVGTPGPNGGQVAEEAADPDTIQDVFFRIGGAETTPVSATVSLLDDASLLDHRRRMGLASRPRRQHLRDRPSRSSGSGLDLQQGRHRRGRQRRQRHRVRPSGRALPEDRGHLDRPGRHEHLLPERAAVRPPQPGGLEQVGDPARLPGVRGQPERQVLPRVRDGQLRRVHLHQCHPVGLHGLRGAQQPGR